MNIFSQKELVLFSEFDNHEFVAELNDLPEGIHGFIAIHNRNLGPATGGTRMYAYKTKEEGLADALRLSRAMTYKCALAGVPYGGGKGVIIGDPSLKKSEELLVAYANNIQELRGEFFTGEDVGLTEDDVQTMRKISSFFIGQRGVAGDPSPYAALSVFYAMEAAASSVFGQETMVNRTVAVKGVGKVGSELVRLLHEAGVSIVVADIDKKRCEDLKKRFPSIVIDNPLAIHRQAVDVYAPCALGNEFTKENVHEIRARIICGSANNQLSFDAVGDELQRRGILYIPDYIANAGGLINVVDELEQDGYRKERVLERITHIKDKVQRIISLSQERRKPTNRVADTLAEQIFKNFSHKSSALL